ncbi:hypothetical protein [Rhizobium sp. Leaf453]|uniref:hypothetical protein n=1 Tax=Rhizobium sp. Leaf453 TaxID=1736380 RepID=UPI000715497D|nr:hypothetical protein [Rhizobium sp. Leaf453]KQU08034.1 hypothetical protein ASG68_23545 [Rhizobium sp. Leaf453]
MTIYSIISAATAAAFFMACAQPVASADATTTYALSVRMETLDKTDCGNGGNDCVPACMVHARLDLLQSGITTSVPIQIAFWHKVEETQEDGEIEVVERPAAQLMFNESQSGKYSETADHTPRFECKDIAVSRISVECPLVSDDRCPGLFYVQIPDIKSWGVKEQIVQAQ